MRAYVEQHQQTINTKAEIILDHFIPKVVNTKKLKGKAMVITQSIESAIGCYKAIQRILDDKGNPFKIVIAFSGTKKVGCQANVFEEFVVETKFPHTLERDQ